MKKKDPSIALKPSEFISEKAKRKQAKIFRRTEMERTPANIHQKGVFYGNCPWCHDGYTVMSPLFPNLPKTTAPNKGDMIKCDTCRRYHVVEQVNGQKVITRRVEIVD